MSPAGDARSATKVSGAEAELRRALELAYVHLGRRARSVAEMRRHLTARGIGERIVEEALAELSHQGYLDDARYARDLAEDHRRLDGWGAQRIRTKLIDAGVPAALVENTLAGAPESELQAALEVLARRSRVAPTDDRGRQRALGLLVRKGYDPDLAYEAIRRFERPG